MSGKAAAFGGRMMNTVADQMLKQFADNFAARVGAIAEPPAAAAVAGTCRRRSLRRAAATAIGGAAGAARRRPRPN